MGVFAYHLISMLYHDNIGTFIRWRWRVEAFPFSLLFTALIHRRERQNCSDGTLTGAEHAASRLLHKLIFRPPFTLVEPGCAGRFLSVVRTFPKQRYRIPTRLTATPLLCSFAQRSNFDPTLPRSALALSAATAPFFPPAHNFVILLHRLI